MGVNYINVMLDRPSFARVSMEARLCAVVAGHITNDYKSDLVLDDVDVPYLARRTKLSEECVEAALQELVDNGYEGVLARPNVKDSTTSRGGSTWGDRKRRAKHPENIQEGDYATDFEHWWNAYPDKRDRIMCRKLWMNAVKSGEITAEGITRSLMQHLNSEQWQKDNGEYIPNSRNWLEMQYWDAQLPRGRTECTRIGNYALSSQKVSNEVSIPKVGFRPVERRVEADRY